jgi:hypothetical protein
LTEATRVSRVDGDLVRVVEGSRPVTDRESDGGARGNVGGPGDDASGGLLGEALEGCSTALAAWQDADEVWGLSASEGDGCRRALSSAT